MLADTPTSDHIALSFRLAPVSQQAQARTKAEFVSSVRAETASAGFLLSGDISLEVEWLVPEQVRYETDRSPDVDNILKPLIDALTGPEGLIIDDNQVQHVSCSWIDSNDDHEVLHIRVRHAAGEWVPKRDLVFVQFARGLCLPIPSHEWRFVSKAWLESFTGLLAARFAADEQGLPYSWSRMLMPQQRVFHRTRLRGFDVIDEETFRERYRADG